MVNRVIDFSAFQDTLSAEQPSAEQPSAEQPSAEQPPPGLSELLRALWLDAKGDFDAAHGIAQDVDTPDGARVHAYLHRKEGDLTNARYWYRTAGVSVESGSLSAEWKALVQRFLG